MLPFLLKNYLYDCEFVVLLGIALTWRIFDRPVPLLVAR